MARAVLACLQDARSWHEFAGSQMCGAEETRLRRWAVPSVRTFGCLVWAGTPRANQQQQIVPVHNPVAACGRDVTNTRCSPAWAPIRNELQQVIHGDRAVAANVAWTVVVAAIRN